MKNILLVGEILYFFNIFVRMSAFIAFVPFFGEKYVFSTLKIMMSMALSWFVFNTLPTSQDTLRIINKLDKSFVFCIQCLLQEIFLSFFFGFICKTAFDIFQWSGSLVGSFMGFSFASVYDHLQENHADVVSKIFWLFSFLLYVTLDGHHVLITVLMRSFEMVPIGHFFSSLNFSIILSDWLKVYFASILQIVAPIGVCLFIVNLFLGLAARLMPQMNLFSVAPIVTSLIGFFLIFLSSHEFLEYVFFYFDRTHQKFFSFFLLY